MSEISAPRLGRRVIARVARIDGRGGPGRCSYGHLAGESFEIGEVCPAGLCAWAFNSLFPFATVLRFGGSLPWEDAGRACVSCPDPDNTVVFELEVVE